MKDKKLKAWLGRREDGIYELGGKKDNWSPLYGFETDTYGSYTPSEWRKYFPAIELEPGRKLVFVEVNIKLIKKKGESNKKKGNS